MEESNHPKIYKQDSQYNASIIYQKKAGECML